MCKWTCTYLWKLYIEVGVSSGDWRVVKVFAFLRVCRNLPCHAFVPARPSVFPCAPRRLRSTTPSPQRWQTFPSRKKRKKPCEVCYGFQASSTAKSFSLVGTGLDACKQNPVCSWPCRRSSAGRSHCWPSCGNAVPKRREHLAHRLYYVERQSEPFCMLRAWMSGFSPIISSSFLPSALDFFIAFRGRKKKNKKHYLNVINTLVKEQNC